MKLGDPLESSNRLEEHRQRRFISRAGTKHFLLMCSVKAEDAGEIHFVARDVESTAYLEVEGQSAVKLRSAVLFLEQSATSSCPSSQSSPSPS